MPVLAPVPLLILFVTVVRVLLATVTVGFKLLSTKPVSCNNELLAAPSCSPVMRAGTWAEARLVKWEGSSERRVDVGMEDSVAVQVGRVDDADAGDKMSCSGVLG